MSGAAFLSIVGIVYWVFATRNTGTCMWADVGAGSRLVWEFAGVSSIVSLLVPQNTILYCNFMIQNCFTSYNLINTPKRLGVISAPTMVSLGWISLLYKCLFQKVNITILLGLLTFLVPWEPAFEIKPSAPARHRTQQRLETLICVHSKEGLKHPPRPFSHLSGRPQGILPLPCDHGAFGFAIPAKWPRYWTFNRDKFTCEFTIPLSGLRALGNKLVPKQSRHLVLILWPHLTSPLLTFLHLPGCICPSCRPRLPQVC